MCLTFHIAVDMEYRIWQKEIIHLQNEATTNFKLNYPNPQEMSRAFAEYVTESREQLIIRN